jgi:hypothetical protein
MKYLCQPQSSFICQTLLGQPGSLVVHFLKNLVMMGGLLRVVADGAGGFAIDDLVQQRQTVARLREGRSQCVTVGYETKSRLKKENYFDYSAPRGRTRAL